MVAVNRKKAKTQAKKEPKAESKLKVISSSIQKKLEKKTQAHKSTRGVMMIKCLPHGFFEEQLKDYFSQFGKVTRVRLARSRKTTKSRGFAFVEFQYPEVAEIAAETMNNYMMFRKMIKTVYIPPDKQRYNYFRSSVLFQTKENGEKVLTSKYLVAREKKVVGHNRPLTEDDKKKRQLNAQKKLLKLKSKFKKFEIDYDVDAITPDSLKGPKVSNKALKGGDSTDETEEESDMDLSDSVEPEKFGFVDDSAEESDAHELDSDASEEPNPKVAKRKLSESVKEAKEARKKFMELSKQEGKGKKGKKEKPIEEEEEDVPSVPEKRGRKKLVGVQKQPKKTQKVQKAITEKTKRALASTLKDTSKVTLVKKTEMKKKKGKK